jgi:hypothetical protein
MMRRTSNRSLEPANVDRPCERLDNKLVDIQ